MSEEVVAEAPKYKVCPICGSRILAVMVREVCEECEEPYELEE